MVSLVLLMTSPVMAISTKPQLFLFLDSDEACKHIDKLSHPYISGAQIIYSWRELEPSKDNYNFTKIERDLQCLAKLHKKLFIQIQDRSFSPNIFNVPNYLRQERDYHGGVAMQYDFPGEGKTISAGWVPRIWDVAVRKRFQLLIEHLGQQFDGKVYGINLPETSIDLDTKNLPKDFSYDKYFQGELENLIKVKNTFRTSKVIQYVNFFPGEWNNDHHYMDRLFTYAMSHDIGLGGPDVVPFRKSHMKNSYPFFHANKDKMLTAIAVQEPDYTYKNPKTHSPYKFSDFYNFARHYLGASIIFWNVEEPFFTRQLIPHLNERYFKLTICDK